MKLILGLDLGVNSVGWAVVREAENEGEVSHIEQAGVRVVPVSSDEQQNFERGKSITTNAEKAAAHCARINLHRYKLRRKNLIECLKANNFINEDTLLYESGNRTTFETYRLRAKAVTEEITLEQLARVLLMINKKRGYKSNRRIKNDADGEAVDGMEVARRLYDEGITPGQLMLQLLNDRKNYVPGFYRSDLLDEFDRICKVQQAFYPEILTDEFVTKIRGASKKATAYAFHSVGIEVADIGGKDKRRRQYELRVMGLDKQLDCEEVAYVLSEINGAIGKSSGYLGEISDRSKELYFGRLTVGQYLMRQLEADPNYSFKNKVFYRQDYLNEFESIWETQSRFHKELTSELKHEVRDIIIFYQRKLRSKKSLVGYCEFESFDKEVTDPETGKVSVKRVGSKVCPKSSPLFQEFKVWQALQNVKIIDRQTGEELPLLPEEKEMLWQELSIREKLDKKEIIVLLRGKGADRRFDLNFTELYGNATQAKLIGCFQEILAMSGHDDAFGKMSAIDLRTAFKALFKGLGWNINVLDFDSSLPGKELVKQDGYKLWHLLYSYEDDDSGNGIERLKRQIDELCNFGGNMEYASVLAKVTFASDYGSLSARAIRKILPYLHEGNVYSQACELAGYRHSKRSLTREEIDNKPLADHIEILPRNSLRNPVVEKILNQMINVVNAVIDKYGHPDEIRVEMARELKQNAKKRETDFANNRKAKARNEDIRKTLQKQFGITSPSHNDIIRYRLYDELASRGYRTLYSDTKINKEELFSNKYDIEHIIPQALLFDDSFSNKTLELRAVNIAKGKLTAMDFVSMSYDPEQYKARVLDLYKGNHISRTKRDKLLMRGQDIPADFLQRDLVNTQYIARKAVEILESVTRSVLCTNGAITAQLREDWQIVDVIKELNWDKYEKLGMVSIDERRNGQRVKVIKDWTKRNDHRHHAMDAITIAFTTRGIIQYLNTLSSLGADKQNVRLRYQYVDEHDKWKFVPPMPIDIFRAEVKRALQGILVSIKSKNKVMTRNTNKIKVGGGYKSVVQLTPRGQLHKEKVYGSIRQYVVQEETVGSKFDEAKIMTVADARYRTALLERLHQYGGDPKKAFTGKNSLEKNPVYIDSLHLHRVPNRVKTVALEQRFTIRKPINKDLPLNKVVDSGIRRILDARLAEYGGDADKAFSNLEESPIYLNRAKGITIKRVTIYGVANGCPIHYRRSQNGQVVTDNKGNELPVDYVSLGNNHHSAVYRDADGDLQVITVPFFEVVERVSQGLPAINKEFKRNEGWQFLYSMKINEYFVFPNTATGFDPNEIDLIDPDNYAAISQNLYRVQKMAVGDYYFRHHLETTVEEKIALKDFTFKRITAAKNLSGIVKVRVNHLGEIVAIGEY